MKSWDERPFVCVEFVDYSPVDIDIAKIIIEGAAGPRSKRVAWRIVQKWRKSGQIADLDAMRAILSEQRRKGRAKK